MSGNNNSDDVEMSSVTPGAAPVGSSTPPPPSSAEGRTNVEGAPAAAASPIYEPSSYDSGVGEGTLLDKDEENGGGPDAPKYGTLIGSAFHIFKGNVGVGIFLLPSVYNDAGYIASPVLSFAVGVMVVDAMIMLLSTKQAIDRDNVQTYPDVVEFVFGSLFKLMVNIAVVVCQLSFCLMYVQVAAGIFSNLLDYEAGYKLFVLINTILVIPFAFLSNNLRLLSFSSFVATILVFVAAVISLEQCGQHIASQGGMATTVTPVGDPSKWILLIASSLTVLEGICIVLPVENSVAPKDKPKVTFMIGLTMFLILIVYFIFGESGYLAFGSDVKNSIVTVLPLDVIGDAARLALAFNLLLTHPLQFVPAIEIIDRALGVTKDRVTKSKKSFAMRIGINVNIMMMAMLLGGDAITIVLALVGATAAVFLAILLPPLMQLHVEYAVAHPEDKREGKSYFKPMIDFREHMRSATTFSAKFKKVRCYVYIVFGVIVFVFGTVTTLIDAAGFRKARGDPSKVPPSGGPPSPMCNNTCPTCPPSPARLLGV